MKEHKYFAQKSNAAQRTIQLISLQTNGAEALGQQIAVQWNLMTAYNGNRLLNAMDLVNLMNNNGISVRIERENKGRFDKKKEDDDRIT